MKLRPTLCACAARRPKAVDMTTEEYPGFATDLQAQYMAWMTVAQGISFVTETFLRIDSCMRWSWRAWARTFGSRAGRP